MWTAHNRALAPRLLCGRGCDRKGADQIFRSSVVSNNAGANASGDTANGTAGRVFVAIVVCALVSNGVWLSLVAVSALTGAAR